MSKKAGIVIGAVLAAAAAVAVGCVVLMGGKGEAYRSIMVYQVNGSATITRERVGDLAAYENLMLQSGDSVSVASESSMRLKLDDDKYLLAEQDTLMNIVAEGDGDDAKTYIDLKQGSVTSEIQNKLGPNASYEVNTPNSIMAVRGTIFRVEVETDENGEVNTKLTVLQGTVSAKTVMPDGTVSNEEVMVEAGKELTITGTPTGSGDLSEPQDIDFEDLPQIMDEYIETLDVDIAENAAEPSGQEQQADASNTKQAQQKEEEQQDPEQQGQDREVPNEPKSGEQEQPRSTEKTPSQQSPQKQEEVQQESEPGLAEQPAAEPQEVTQSEPQPSKTEPQSKPQASNQNTDSSSQGDSGSGGSKKKTQYYTVTFQYNGSTFGTQRVKKGNKAAEPELCPTENGAWDYDFSKKVNKNITVQWVEK